MQPNKYQMGIKCISMTRVGLGHDNRNGINSKQLYYYHSFYQY